MRSSQCRTTLGVTILLIAVFAANPPARAQVIARPNQITGTFQLTNTNPDILALLQTRGLHSLWVEAKSQGLTPQLTCSAAGVIDDPLHGHYEIVVESADPGIVYDVTAAPGLRGGGCRWGSGISDPVLPEPTADVVLSFEKCVGAVHVFLVDDGGQPVYVESGTVNGISFSPGSNDAWIIVPGDATIRLDVYYRAGTDPMHDTVITRIQGDQVFVGCDETVEHSQVVCVADASGTASGLGRIIGEVDVRGATLVPEYGPPSYDYMCTGLSATLGPFGNARYDALQGARLRGDYELENLVPSDASGDTDTYTVHARVSMDVNGHVESMVLPYLEATVLADQTTDLGDAFVVDPATVIGEVLVVGPPPSARRGRAMLGDVATVGHGSMTGLTHGTGRIAPDARRSSLGLQAGVACDRAYDDTLGKLVGGFELLTGGLHAEASIQAIANFGMFCVRQEERSDPDDWYRANVTVTNEEYSSTVVRPGDTWQVPLHACMGQVTMGFQTTDGLFYGPKVETFSGRFDGVDFEGNVRRLKVTASGIGLPDRQEDAARDGSVKLLAPAGHYVFKPHVTFLNPSGGTSETDLRDVEVDVGCRQVLEFLPEIVVGIHEAATCAGANPVTIRGSVTADDDIASITWSANGSQATDICRPCGHDPDFSVVVAPPGGDMELTVTATDVRGRRALATTSSREAQEPSALDVVPSAEPLRVSRAGATAVAISWGAAPGESHSLYRGTVESLWKRRAYNHAGFGACGLTQPVWSGTVPEGSFYYLATCSCSFGDASLGRDSFGREIPMATPRCP